LKHLYRLTLLLKGQESNSNKLESIENDLGFLRLALQNEELLKSNDPKQ